MDKLLKEAIADAKSVRESAIANAKNALLEAFEPKLHSMLSAKINEEEDEDTKEKDEMDENSDSNLELEAAAAEKSAEEDETKEEENDEEMDENTDFDALLAELEADSDPNEKEEKEETTEAKKSDNDDEKEIDLDELLAELEMEGKKADSSEPASNDDKDEEICELKSELNETRKVVKLLKDKLNEVNLLNSKLLFSTKLFKNYELNEKQKVKILESLDRTKSVREVKLVYTTLVESLKNTSSKKNKITESIGLASKASGASGRIITEESSDLAARFRKLANLK